MYNSLGDYMKVVITGGSRGLGYEFAKIYAKKGYELLLISRDIDRLENVKKDLFSKYKVDIEVYKCDLSSNDELDKLIIYLKNVDFNVFINNAGFGYTERFIKSNDAIVQNMISLNIVSLHRLFIFAYRKLVKLENGIILNVSSVASVLPGPHSHGYFATKAYIYSLTKSVAIENIKQKNKLVIKVVCPPPMKTDFMKRANMGLITKHTKCEKVAKKTYKGLRRKRVIIVPGLNAKFSYYFGRLMPNYVVSRVMYKIIYKRNKNV